MHITTTLDLGGAENQLLLLVREQIKQGFEVYVFDLKGQQEQASEFTRVGAKVSRTLNGKNFVIQSFKLRKFLKTFSRGVLLHAHLPQAEIVSSIAKRKRDLLVVTRHFGGKFYPSANLLVSSFLGVLSSIRASKVIAISESVKNTLLRNREVFHTKEIEVIYYGFDSLSFSNQVEATKSPDLNYPITLGTVSRLSGEKNVHLIIEAFKELKSDIPLRELKIVGVGPLCDELKLLAVELGLEESVRFLGKRKDIASQINEMDIFILASSFEGFGMVLLEAMALRKRIVASRNSAIQEIIGETDCGVLFETGNVNELVKAVKRALNLDHKLLANAQREKLEFFSIKVTAERTLDLYKSIINS